MNILNLYAGIGGNRKLWSEEHSITAVEFDPKIAEVYQSLYPKDTVVIGDAHQYLLDHYKEFDFIWSSPPCQTHSVCNHFLNAQGVVRYPDMSLWQEILFLKTFCKTKFVVENVKSYYTPLIEPQKCGRHYFWSNFEIPYINTHTSSIGRFGPTKKGRTDNKSHHKLGIDLSNYKIANKTKLLNNCVIPELGLHILKQISK